MFTELTPADLLAHVEDQTVVDFLFRESDPKALETQRFRLSDGEEARWVKGPAPRVAAAARATSNPELLAKLARDPRVTVKEAVARNEHTPPHAVEDLVAWAMKERHTAVFSAAIHRVDMSTRKWDLQRLVFHADIPALADAVAKTGTDDQVRAFWPLVNDQRRVDMVRYLLRAGREDLLVELMMRAAGSPTGLRWLCAFITEGGLITGPIAEAMADQWEIRPLDVAHGSPAPNRIDARLDADAVAEAFERNCPWLLALYGAASDTSDEDAARCVEALADHDLDSPANWVFQVIAKRMYVDDSDPASWAASARRHGITIVNGVDRLSDRVIDDWSTLRDMFFVCGSETKVSNWAHGRYENLPAPTIARIRELVDEGLVLHRENYEMSWPIGDEIDDVELRDVLADLYGPARVPARCAEQIADRFFRAFGSRIDRWELAMSLIFDSDLVLSKFIELVIAMTPR